MKHIHILLIPALLLSIVSHAQEKFITVGSGGGFAGTATVYKITTSGKVFKGNGVGEIKYTECAKIKKAKAKKYVQTVSELTQSSSPFSHPGNMYYFINYTDNNGEHKATWGDVQYPVPESIQKLYQEINIVIGSARFKPIQ
jgi:hypothetical protein